MTGFHWLIVLLGVLPGFVAPRLYSLLAGILLLMAYSAGKPLGWPRYQLAVAYLFGGLATGAGLHLIVGYGMRDQVVPMVVAPLLLWLAARVVFVAAETRYSLTPKVRSRVVPIAAHSGGDKQYGVSAWSGESSGGSRIPDAEGRRILWEFFANGELCMGGLTFGDAVFSNHCAFQGVGPSIVIDDAGQYAAMTLPSRGAWGLLLVDLRARQAYFPQVDDVPWELDSIRDGAICGRESPLTHDTALQIRISDVLAITTPKNLVEDDGWWLLDYPDRKPLPRYPAVTQTSRTGEHELTLVPDLRPFKRNPFLRDRSPEYSLLVDRSLLELSVRKTKALWVDSAEYEGRYLVIDDQVLDLMPAGVFTLTDFRCLGLNIPGDDVALHIGALSTRKPGELTVEAQVMYRSVGIRQAEYWSGSTTFPYDEDQQTYWDAQGGEQVRIRARVARHRRYHVDLFSFFRTGQLHHASRIELINRTQPDQWACLTPVAELDKTQPYARFRCQTACGVDPGEVLAESIWSRCGRYLAVVPAAVPPAVPDTIRIIDTETATQRDLPGRYACPSFIWFESDLLDFSCLTGVIEHLLRGPGQSTEQRFMLSDPAWAAHPYELLFAGMESRRAAVRAEVDRIRSSAGYVDGSVHHLSMHYALFGPAFDRPVAQPPFSVDH